jgi:hypothetical protein
MGEMDMEAAKQALHNSAQQHQSLHSDVEKSLASFGDMGETRRQSWLDTEKNNEKVWSYKSTISFWCSIYFTAGSLLFVVGSAGMIPGFCPPGEEHEVYFRTWVDYPFMVGAWCFTIANYGIYFQVLNQLNSHGATSPHGADEIALPSFASSTLTRLRWVVLPTSDLGHLAALMNVIGSLLYNVNTMGMYGGPNKFGLGFDIGYVSTGAVGSLFFAVGAALEGEYNGWRRLSLPETRSNSAVWMSYFSFIGALLFFVGYSSDYNHFADHSTGVTTWGVAVPFLVGSLFFLASSWMAQFLWKAHVFGLGFAQELTAGAQITWNIDWAQQFMLGIYCLNLCGNWLAFFILSGDPMSADNFDDGWSALLRVSGYTCILGLASVVHFTPKEHPYVALFWIMRFTALLDLVGGAIAVYHTNKLLLTR